MSMANPDDKYELNRFIKAQQTEYATALAEIQQGKKESHWMWYIFPQALGLGFTSAAMEYGIKDLEEATAYVNHPILGNRLVEISAALLPLETNDAAAVFDRTDSMKLRSCMTLFALVPGANPVFQQVLDKFFNGRQDEMTLKMLGV